jgi:hypothetical protein
MRKIVILTMATPTNVPVDSFEAVRNAGLELEVGAAKAVGLVLEPVTRITVPRPDEDVVPVGSGNEEIKLIVALTIVVGEFENIYVNEYAAHPAFPALSISTSAVAGQFAIRQLAARLPIDCWSAGWHPQD